MSALNTPPSVDLYDAEPHGSGVLVAFSEDLDADGQSSLIDWLTAQRHLRYVRYTITQDGREAVLLTNEVQG